MVVFGWKLIASGCRPAPDRRRCVQVQAPLAGLGRSRRGHLCRDDQAGRRDLLRQRPAVPRPGGRPSSSRTNAPSSASRSSRPARTRCSTEAKQIGFTVTDESADDGASPKNPAVSSGFARRAD